MLSRPAERQGSDPYPRGKISPLQEKLFCTLGGNIETVAIDGDFDAGRW